MENLALSQRIHCSQAAL